MQFQLTSKKKLAEEMLNGLGIKWTSHGGLSHRQKDFRNLEL